MTVDFEELGESRSQRSSYGIFRVSGPVAEQSNDACNNVSYAFGPKKHVVTQIVVLSKEKIRISWI